MSYAFYALPEELKFWLNKLIGQENIWCLSWHPLKRRYDYIESEKDVKTKSFEAENEGDLIFFLGNRDLVM
ncbi:MAG: hypothetical protein N2257_01735 [Thermodesulfovibrionales bacterium]|nr:hypothetical protein [Thermodesulfovibrionales bacterium]